jgi:hypothetical protein
MFIRNPCELCAFKFACCSHVINQFNSPQLPTNLEMTIRIVKRSDGTFCSLNLFDTVEVKDQKWISLFTLRIFCRMTKLLCVTCDMHADGGRIFFLQQFPKTQDWKRTSSLKKWAIIERISATQTESDSHHVKYKTSVFTPVFFSVLLPFC